jgi:hypothetical protein
VLDVIDTSSDIRNLLTVVFEEAGFRVISPFDADLNRGALTLADFLR